MRALGGGVGVALGLAAGFAGGSVADGDAGDWTPVPGPGVGEGRRVVDGLPIGGGVGGGVAAAATYRADGTLQKKTAASTALTATKMKKGDDFTF